ncbi:DUF6701 domain-containing protein [Massilia sp. W12]|uniref:DUF6701 domain-containing protein n=1 Tax=Massilia sp. W12 TaxID=3126507 RepID=UPI0030CBD033
MRACRFAAWLWSLACLLLLFCGQAGAVAISITANTSWNAINSGSGPSGRPSAADTITVSNNATLTVNSTAAVSGNITLGGASPGTLAFSNSSARLTISGSLTLGAGSVAGNLNLGAGSLTLQQFIYVNGSFTPGSGSVTMTANNSLPNSSQFASFFNFTQNGGVTTMTRDVSIGGVLTLTNGSIDSNGRTLTAVAANCASAVTRTNGFVNGFLRLAHPSGSSACTYPLGSATGYAPVTMNFTASSAGTLTVASLGAEHPQISSSSIDSTRNVNRYYSIWQSGDTVNVTAWGFTLNYVAGDLDLAANSANFVLGRYNGAVWSLPSGFTRTANAITLNLSGALNSNLQYAIGEVSATCNLPSDITTAMSCVCENFRRPVLNPSTIYGGDWVLSSSGGTFGVPRIVNQGQLRLTDNSATVATAATIPANFPAAGNLILVEFKAYAYNGSGADGMAITLSDSAINPLPGAYGGSLGYAQKVGSDCTNPSGCAGFAGGWIGVALDEYGNFSNPTEGRVGGPGSRADAIVVRGSGSGASSSAGNYPYLDGTGTLSPGIDNPSSSTLPAAVSYRVMVDARAYSPSSKTAQVSVFRDTTGAGNFTPATQLLNFDAYVKNPSQAPVPSSWKLSFTGSTGGLSNIHEIGDLKVCAQSLNPPTSFRIDVDNLSPSTCTTATSGRPVITITALDINRNTNTSYNKTVILRAVKADGSLSSAVWSVSSGSGVLSGNQYTFALADKGVAKFVLTDSTQEDVYVGVVENGSPYSVSYASPLQFRGGSFSIANIDALAAGSTEGGVVAGRPHLFQITKNNGCGVSSSFNGSVNLDGWYSPASTHPGGAAAPQLCQPVGNACIPNVGSCVSLPNSPPALSASSNNLPVLNFVNGRANVCLVTTDVGRYSLNVRDDSDITAPLAGASSTLTARPFAIVLRDVKAGAINNPALDSNTNPAAPWNVSNPENAPLFIAAAKPFSATVAAYRWSAAADSGNNGLPGAGATLAQVSAAGLTASYADLVSLSNQSAAGSWTPAAGVVGGLNSSVSVVNGGVTVSNLSYPEVGSFQIKATPTQSFLGSGVDLANRVAIYANPAFASRSAWIGRFNPNHFSLTSSVTQRSDINSGAGCSPASAFTYMGESFNLNFTLSAMNFSGVRTHNYFGPFAKLDGANWFGLAANNSLGLGVLGAGVVQGGATCNAVFDRNTPGRTSFRNCSGGAPSDILRSAGPRLSLLSGSANPVWSAGQANFSASLQFERADVADGPYNTFQIGLAPTDAEGVSLQTLDLDADQNGVNERLRLHSIVQRHGRMLIANAYGSELLPLPVSLQAQYWDGAKYVRNSDDNCTPLPAASFSINNWSANGGLTSNNMNAANIPANSGVVSSGNGVLRLSKPAPFPDPATNIRKPGSVNLNSLISYLPGTGRLSFGLYKAGPVIYIREVY